MRKPKGKLVALLAFKGPGRPDTMSRMDAREVTGTIQMGNLR